MIEQCRSLQGYIVMPIKGVGQSSLGSVYDKGETF